MKIRVEMCIYIDVDGPEYAQDIEVTYKGKPIDVGIGEELLEEPDGTLHEFTWGGADD